jgi:tetratricopeptide (TPR) repeat protein
MAGPRLAGTLVLLCLAAIPALAQVNPNLLLFEARLPPGAQTSTPAHTAAARPERAQAAPESAAGQEPATPPVAAARLLGEIDAYQERISTLIGETGPFDFSLVQEYASLGRLYQQAGQHEQAVEAFAQAEYVARINEGLDSPQAFASIEAAVESHIAMGNLSAANEKLQFLLYLNREHYGSNSLELVPLLTNLGDWHMYSFSQAVSRPSIPGISINFGNSRGRDANPRALAFGSLFRARRMYEQAIGTLLGHQILYAPELITLEEKLVESTFLAGHREGFLRNPAFFVGQQYAPTSSRLRRKRIGPGYVEGRNAYERMRIYHSFQYQAEPLDLARIMVAEADWHLIHDRHSKALRVYREALDLMRELGAPQSLLQATFAPDLPVQLPAFAALPHSRAYMGIAEEAELDYEGYVDLSFEISRYGSAKRIRILGSSEGTDPDVVNRLRRLLRSMPFRPVLLEDSEAARQKKLRYYYTQVTAPGGS